MVRELKPARFTGFIYTKWPLRFQPFDSVHGNLFSLRAGLEPSFLTQYRLFCAKHSRIKINNNMP